jgi:Raf kinase inhibitor-like YbhB/YbcL family protein
MRRTAAICTAVVLAGCGGGGGSAGGPLPAAPRTLRLTSPAFVAGRIPRRYTCDGSGVSPPLSWSRVPAAARSLALVVDDEDANGFVHWMALDLPPRARGLAAGRVPPGTAETENSFGRRGYGGPCPPRGAGTHRYRFTLYALSRRVAAGGTPSPAAARRAIRGAALGRGELTAGYSR